jgi:hypothetical protein
VILTASSVSGFSTGPAISQIQESGVKINDESLPPQLALYYSFHNNGSGETQNVQNHLNLSEESTEQHVLLESQVRANHFLNEQEEYKRDSIYIEPGLGIRKLIFPFHFHT